MILGPLDPSQRRRVASGVVQGLGHTARARPAAELPDKEPGRHRWIATTAHVLTDGQARDAYREGQRIVLGVSNLLDLSVGCWDCEQPWQECHGQPCPGDPAGGA